VQNILFGDHPDQLPLAIHDRQALILLKHMIVAISRTESVALAVFTAVVMMSFTSIFLPLPETRPDYL